MNGGNFTHKAQEAILKSQSLAQQKGHAQIDALHLLLSLLLQQESVVQVLLSKIGILGVAYKGNVPDARETPAKVLINILKEKNARVYANDPHTPDDIIKSLGAEPADVEEVLNCDCVILICCSSLCNYLHVLGGVVAIASLCFLTIT